MERSAYREEIKLKLTGNLLDLELDDSDLDSFLNASLREVQRYICSTKLATIPFRRCINLSNVEHTNGETLKINAVVRIYRADGFMPSTNEGVTSAVDPMYASQWQLISGTGNMYNFQDYVYNYASWNTMMQIRNTTSTDLAFKFDKSTNQLYINTATGLPSLVTIEYVPRYDDVNEITSDYWIDILMRLTIANIKVSLGRIRSRYTQSNAIWTQDGDTILAEGNAELTELRQTMQRYSQLCYGID